MTDAELLARARQFVESGWCKNAFARTIRGARVNPLAMQARCWCPIGALVAAGIPVKGISRHSAILLLEAALDGEMVHRFNDRQNTVQPVLAAFDRAILLARPV